MVTNLGIALTGEGFCSKNSIHLSSKGIDLCVKTSFHNDTATSTGNER